MDLADGKFMSNRALKWKTWQDSFTGMRYIYLQAEKLRVYRLNSWRRKHKKVCNSDV